MKENNNRFNIPNKFSNICFITLTQTGTYQACLLKEKVQSLPQASYSPLLTLAAFVLFHHPTIQPPRFQCHEKTNGKVDKVYPCQQLSVNNYFQPWSDYLSTLLIQKKVYQENDKIYVLDFVSKEYIQNYLKSEVFCFKQLPYSKDYIQKLQEDHQFAVLIQSIFGLQIRKIEKTKKMAAVCFSAGDVLVDRYLPRVHIGALFCGQFYRETDTWSIYKPVKGIFPSQKQLEQLDGIILSGSAFSVYEDIPQINQFMSMLFNAFQKNKKLQILGFCFGHQAIAYQFGGKVTKMKQQVVNLQNIKFDKKVIDQLKLPWFQRSSEFINGKQSYLVSQFHGDAVVQLPKGFKNLGSSESCQNEAMISQDKRCLSFQFHMEYSPQFAGAYELRLQSYDKDCRYGRIYDGSSKLNSCDRNLRSIIELREISRKFLQGKD